MIFDQKQQLFLAALRAALHGEHLETLPDTEALCGAMAIALQQGILPVVLEAIPAAQDPQPESDELAAYRQLAISQSLQLAERTLDFRALYRFLRQNGLHPVVFKGVLCSRLYPLEFHRTSGDNDLYVPPAELPNAHRLLLEYGLSMTSQNEHYFEVTYRDTDNRIHVEIHRSLFETGVVATDDLNQFFCNIFAQTIEIDGWLSMPPHEHMLYLLLHAYKHFINCGIGLRHACDVALWARTYGSNIDWKILLTQCESVHAEKFAAALFRISEQYLGILLPLPNCWRAILVNPEPLLADMLSGGVFGFRRAHSMLSTALTMNAVKRNHSGRISSVWHNFFPPRRLLLQRYPYLRRHPFLLPIAWISRILNYLFRWHRQDNITVAESHRMSKARLNLLKQYGIIR